MQISNNGSGVHDDGLNDERKVLTVFLLNLIACILCCGAIQGIIALSKKMNAHMILLRKNHKQYKGLLKYREFQKKYFKEKESLDEASDRDSINKEIPVAVVEETNLEAEKEISIIEPASNLNNVESNDVLDIINPNIEISEENLEVDNELS